MKDVNGNISYKGKDYTLVFNLNVMESIQEEYGTIQNWAELTDGSSGEPNAKAVIFGFWCMINEGIDIQNEEGADEKPFTLKQIGRLITEVGLNNATQTLNETVIESSKSAEKKS